MFLLQERAQVGQEPQPADRPNRDRAQQANCRRIVQQRLVRRAEKAQAPRALDDGTIPRKRLRGEQHGGGNHNTAGDQRQAPACDTADEREYRYANDRTEAHRSGQPAERPLSLAFGKDRTGDGKRNTENQGIPEPTDKTQAQQEGKPGRQPGADQIDGNAAEANQ
jgi:hypothetical protein